mmetsp:Transcript_27828/g.80716  ORF Transcript_27828/g.80716 Transcript_27828/m.80716 type:complete len:691 (+) Transcript_27828:176-2248(+)
MLATRVVWPRPSNCAYHVVNLDASISVKDSRDTEDAQATVTWMPRAPDVFAGFDVVNCPLVRPPPWGFPTEADLHDLDPARRRGLYWPAAFASMSILAAVAAQLLATAVILFRRRRHGSEGWQLLPQRAGNAPIDQQEDTWWWRLDVTTVVYIQIIYTLLTAAIIGYAYTKCALSPTTGLAWEAWCWIVCLNSFDVIVQAGIRGATIPLSQASQKIPIIIVDALLINVPSLSPRMDLMKDMVFVATCLICASDTIDACLLVWSQDILVATLVRYWKTDPLREEVRFDHFKVCSPRRLEAPPTFLEALLSGDVSTRKDFLKGVFVSWSTPLQQESALYEDLPQAVVQVIFMVRHKPSALLLLIIFIAIINICRVFVAARLSEGCGSVEDLMRTLRGSYFPLQRSAAAKRLGQLLGKVPPYARAQMVSLLAVVASDDRAECVRAMAIDILTTTAGPSGDDSPVRRTRDSALSRALQAKDRDMVMKGIQGIDRCGLNSSTLLMGPKDVVTAGQVEKETRVLALKALYRLTSIFDLIREAVDGAKDTTWNTDPEILEAVISGTAYNPHAEVRKQVYAELLDKFEDAAFSQMGKEGQETLRREATRDGVWGRIQWRLRRIVRGFTVIDAGHDDGVRQLARSVYFEILRRACVAISDIGWHKTRQQRAAQGPCCPVEIRRRAKIWTRKVATRPALC